MALRTAVAVTAGKAAAFASRSLGRGGGTALPGVISERIAPDLLAQLGRQLGRGSILITGTNGKTTTSRMLARMVETAGIQPLHNREGSNLTRGLASALLAVSNLRGCVRGADSLQGLFEVDEATLPAAARALRPRAIAFTNLFRDQLDRYGEVDTVFLRWQEALEGTSRDSTLVLNADDPSVAELAMAWEGPVHWFGLDDPAFATDDHGAFDARWCRACGGSFIYERRYFAHVGLWRCAGCSRTRPAPDTSATAVRLSEDGATFAEPRLGEMAMPMTGLYNIYNALAAIALGRVLDLGDSALREGLASVRAAFGRQETADLQGRRLRLLLAKNPAGANQVIRMLAGDASDHLNLAVLLNARIADGQDVSWIWDVDYELLAARIDACWVGGDRAEDMALRLKYAAWPEPLAVVHDPAALLDAILAAAPPGAAVAVCPTYTAMLDLRSELARRDAVSQFWDT